MRRSIVVLAGGNSTRFGEDKALYKYNGTSFLQMLIDTFRAEEEIIISVNTEKRARRYRAIIPRDVQVVIDQGICDGPLDGILSATMQTTCDNIVFCPVDIPFIDRTDVDLLDDELGHSQYSSYIISGMFSALLFAVKKDYVTSFKPTGDRAIELLRRAHSASLIEVVEEGRLCNINTKKLVPDNIPQPPTIGEIKRLKIKKFQDTCEGLHEEYYFWKGYPHLQRVIERDIKKRCED